MKKTLFFAILAIIAIFAMATSVQATGNIAKIGDTEFATLQDAIDSVATDATEATTIVLLKDVEDGAGFVTKKGQNIVIDFNEHTYKITDSKKLVGSTGTKTLGCQLNKGSKVTLKNGTFESDVAKMLVQNYSDLTVMDMTLDKQSTEGSYALSNNCGEVYIGGETNIYSNKIAFDVCWATNAGYKEGTQVTVETTGEIVGDIEIAKWNEETPLEGANEKNTLLIKDISHTGFIIPELNFKEQITIQGGSFSDKGLAEYVDTDNGYVGRSTMTSDGQVYLVGKEYSITVKDAEGGEVIIDQSKALEGELVNWNYNDYTGYRFDGLDISDMNHVYGRVLKEVTPFEMWGEDVLITPIFTDIQPGKHKITVKEVEGGKITLSTNEALPGEIITVKVEENPGYVFEYLTYSSMDENMGGPMELEGENTFEMPNEDFKLIPVFTKLVGKIELPENMENVEEIEKIVGETIKANEELLEEFEGKEIVVKVELEEKKVEKEEAKAIETAAAKEVKDIKVTKYIDITIAVKDSKSGETLKELPELKEALTFTVEVPEDLPEVPEGFKRVFYIVRNHNGDVKLLDTTLSKDGKTIEFESDKFSTYAIAYADVKEEVKDNSNNPGTGDNILVYATALVVSVVGIATIAIVRKRNRVSK